VSTPSRKKRFLQISLRAALIAVTLLAAGLAYYTNVVRHQAALAASLRADGFMLTYEQSAPPWVVSWVGEDAAGKITGVAHSGLVTLDAERLQSLADLGTVRRLSAPNTMSDDSTFRAIGSIVTLRQLVLSTPPFPNGQLKHFRNLDQLEVLYITQPIGDAGIAALCELKSLKRLSISFEGLTQNGIQQLAALEHLQWLKIRGGLSVTRQTREALQGVAIDDGSFRRSLWSIPVAPVVLSNAAEER